MSIEAERVLAANNLIFISIKDFSNETVEIVALRVQKFRLAQRAMSDVFLKTAFQAGRRLKRASVCILGLSERCKHLGVAPQLQVTYLSVFDLHRQLLTVTCVAVYHIDVTTLLPIYCGMLSSFQKLNMHSVH